MRNNNSAVGLVLVFLAQIMVAINIVASKNLLTSMPSVFILAVRFALAALILFILHSINPKSKQSLSSYFRPLKRKDWCYIIAQSLTAGVFFNLLMLWGLHYIDANNAGIMTSILPLMIALLSWLVLAERFTRPTFISIVLVTIGLVVISLGDIKDGFNSSLIGYLLILLSLLPEALYYISSKIHRLPLPIFLLSALLNGINAIILTALLPFISLSDLNCHYNQLGTLLILGLSSGLFYVFWYYGCEKVDGMLASLSTAIMPISTIILAWLFLGEQLTMIQLLGMGIIIASVLSYLKAY